MRTPAILVYVFAGALPGLSQVMPEALLDRLPWPPSNVCRSGGEERCAFSEQLNAAMKSVDEQIAKCKQQEREGTRQLEGRMKAQAMEAAGISSATAAGAKKMSKEEKRALANQTLQAQTGMTMDDVQKLKAMSPEARRAWATGKASAGELGPRTGRPQAAKMPGSNLTMDAMQEQTRLMQENAARRERIQQRYAQLEKDYAATPRPEEAKRDYSSKNVPSDPRCQEFAKRYLAILADHLVATRRAIQDGYRLEQLQAKQYGLQSWPGSGSSGLQAVRDYGDRLGEVGQFIR